MVVVVDQLWCHLIKMAFYLVWLARFLGISYLIFLARSLKRYLMRGRRLNEKADPGMWYLVLCFVVFNLCEILI